MYSTEDLVRLELITIQELMKKIDKLEERISDLDKKENSDIIKEREVM